MKAEIAYRIGCVPHPWDEKRRQDCTNVWCLIKVVRPEAGPVKEQEVAIFNLDSEAELFMAQVFTSGLNDKFVSIPSDYAELFKLQTE